MSMVIRINNEQIDTRLENEENAYEVVQQLDAWLLNEGFFISSILVNGRAASPDDKARLTKLALTRIELLDITALPLDEYSFEKFATLLRYFSFLHQGVKEENRRLIDDLMTELPHILGSIDSVLRLTVGTRLISEVLAERIATAGLREGRVDPSGGLEEFLRNICIYIEGRMREIANPLLELKSAAELLESQIPKLEDVPVLLQTGKEREAMELVVAFTEIAEKLTRLYPLLTEKEEENLMTRLVQELPFSQFYEGLNLQLRELIEAMESEDSILIGDLLEYEIAPKISALTRSIEALPAFSGGTL